MDGAQLQCPVISVTCHKIAKCQRSVIFIHTLKKKIVILALSLCSLVGTGGHCFNPKLGQYSFKGLMIVIAT